MEKCERFGLVLTPAEKNTLVRLAENEGGLSQAAFVRRLIRDAGRAAGLWPPTQPQTVTLQGVENERE